MAKTVDLSQVVPGYQSGAREFIVENKKTGNVEVVTREDLTRYDPEQIGTAVPKPFQHQVVDGSNLVAESYLQKEFPYMLQFFQERGVSYPHITYDFDTPGEYWLKVDFPLPKQVQIDGQTYRFTYDKEAFLFVLNSYPDSPPIGFHVPKESKHIAIFNQIFETHLFNRAILERSSVEQALKKDWDWICFHYEDNTWNFNRTDIKEGDSLSWFFYYIYHKLQGVQGITS